MPSRNEPPIDHPAFQKMLAAREKVRQGREGDLSIEEMISPDTQYMLREFDEVIDLCDAGKVPYAYKDKGVWYAPADKLIEEFSDYAFTYTSRPKRAPKRPRKAPQAEVE